MIKVAFLSRYQNTINRGAETYVKELSKRLEKDFDVEILEGEKSDSLKTIMGGNYDWVISVNGGSQALKASVGRFFKKYKLLISGQAGIGRTNIWNVAVGPDIFVALTDYMAKWIKKWVWRSKVIKIPNGVDLNKFKPEGKKIEFDLDGPIILSVGALYWYKHHERTIAAVSHLQKGSLVIVGDGDEEDNLSEMGELKLSGRFKIIHSNYNELDSIYRSADVFVLPSWNREAFGIVYAEALASNLPVVAPDDESRHEIVGDAGIFASVEDPKKYAEAIEFCLNKDWGKKARKQAEQFSWDKIAESYTKILKNI